MLLLTDEEMLEDVKKWRKAHNDEMIDFDSHNMLQRKAQLKKVVEWGDEDCPHNPKPIRLKVKRGCLMCWQSLLDEIKVGPAEDWVSKHILRRVK